MRRPELDPLSGGMWMHRVFRYLRKISVDPDTFERVMWNRAMPLSLDDPLPKIRSVQEMTKVQQKHVQRSLVTLGAAIEQFEAEYEE